MATINYAAREISVKVVYYGPGLSGKTTNLQIIHKKIPPDTRSDMVSLATEADRTLFFDFLPLDLGKIKGFSTKFQLYTVPGQVYYNATRKLVLRGVDGIVFVADSAADKMDENLESFRNMEENLIEYGYQRDSIPIILQYNKRDLPNALSVNQIDSQLNKYNLPWNEAVAVKGNGVFESLKLIGKLVIDQLNQKYSSPPRRQPISGMTAGARTASAMSSAAQPKPVTPPPSQQYVPQHQQRQQTPREMPKKQDYYGAPPSQQSRPSVPPAPSINQNRDYSQYGTIDLDRMAPNRPAQNDRFTPPSQPKNQNNTDLDQEIERYHREIQLQQRKQQDYPSQHQRQQPLNSASQQQFYTQRNHQHPSAPMHSSSSSDEAVFDPYENAQKPPLNQRNQQPFSTPFGNNAPQQPLQPDSFAYPQRSPQHLNSDQSFSQPDNFSHDQNQSDNPMFFTSVNTEKTKRKGKKPVNPKLKPKKGFFKNLFNKDSF